MTLVRTRLSIVVVALGSVVATTSAALSDQGRSPGRHAPGLPSSDTPGAASLQPAEGASVAIITPAPGAIFSADEVPLQFTLIKGKRGEHVHAYVDGELMGMFKSDRGTLTGIAPGAHLLELRVAAKDHRTELDAVDRVEFVVE